MGYFRIGMGSNLLQIEADCAWATPATWTEHNFGCYEVKQGASPKRVFFRPTRALPAG